MSDGWKALGWILYFAALFCIGWFIGGALR